MIVLLVFLSYLIGSISFGYLIAKHFKGVDIREVGSGSTGATNISRLMGFKVAGLVLILDALKGFLVAVLSSHLTGEDWAILLCGLAVIIGHSWPLFFGFKGGRGSATALGFFIGFAPFPTLIVFLFAIVVIALTRYVSLGSILGSIAIPVYMLFLPEYRPYFVFGLVSCLIIIFRHIPNIKRLIQGKEPKLGEKTGISLKGR